MLKPRLSFPKIGGKYHWQVDAPGHLEERSKTTWLTESEAREGFQLWMDAAVTFHRWLSAYDGKRLR